MKTVFLDPVRQDLQDFRRYVINKFGGTAWKATRDKIADAVADIEASPRKGATPPELVDFRMTGYYEVVSGTNRIIYKVDDDTIYVHLVVDMRSDLEDILARRLFRI
ncbi:MULTISPECIES: type II toxin-antitoxin system RelE/ParE family toxin [unclassified Caballeronia]|jgi:Txe/YoeB family toxin of Txe-Axe toxin-antitoxin module|uniref:type II toxin-antitoxin system RelE/ParE family toxin n=1 Tax=unclassified Caballeronia TaxID=2646786 RepID=UPI0015886089|nr:MULTISPECIES: type II toxin-antitoxin system RelE/ParE family toxin [unclassified Caballeronia]QSN61388.1 type II toxin-antitoxin system RelE/ParE family toxin [Caballeronia sp. M1242]